MDKIKDNNIVNSKISTRKLKPNNHIILPTNNNETIKVSLELREENENSIPNPNISVRFK
jgi:hypothetical protein